MTFPSNFFSGCQFFAFVSGVSAGLAYGGPAALANDLGASPASARAEAMCAAYGPGFKAIEGSDACVFVGGHIRVGFGTRVGASADNGWANGSTVKVNAAGVSAAGAGHLRLPAGDAPGTIAR